MLMRVLGPSPARLLLSQQQITSTTLPSWCAAHIATYRRCTKTWAKQGNTEHDLSQLQRFAADTGSKASSRTAPAVELNKLLGNVASNTNKMSIRQLCRLAFVLTRLQQTTANVKPLWQSVLRRLVQASMQAPAQHGTDSSHTTASTPQAESSNGSFSDSSSSSSRELLDTVKASSAGHGSQLQQLLLHHTSPGDVLYLLRALAAWQEDEVGHDTAAWGFLLAAPQQGALLTGDAAIGKHIMVTAAVAAASSRADLMTLQELLLSVTALAQLSYFDSHLLSTASAAFIAAVAASADRLPAVGSVQFNNKGHSQGVSSKGTSSEQLQQQEPLQPPQQEQQRQQSQRLQSQPTQQQQRQQQQPQQPQQPPQQQQQQQELLPGIRDHQLIINYLWANASLAHSDPLLLHAALQLLLSRNLVCNISRSHLPLCIWSLSALLVCDQQQQQKQQQQQQQQVDMVDAVVAVHDMLVRQAHQLWLESSSETTFYQQQHSGDSKQLQQPTHSASSTNSSSDSSGSSTSRSRSRRNKVASSSSSSRQQPSQKGSVRLKEPFSIESRRQMYQAQVWLQAAAAAAAGGEVMNVGEAHTRVAAIPVSACLNSLADLLALAQQQQRQQQVAAGLALEEGFWHYCASAWSNTTTQVSGLQQQVFQALQSAGFDPVLEFPAQRVTQLTCREYHTFLRQKQQEQQRGEQQGQESQDQKHKQQQQEQQQQQQQQRRGDDEREQRQVVMHGSAAEVLIGFLSVDIACVLPREVLALMQTHGVKGALGALQKQQKHQGRQQQQDSDALQGRQSLRSTEASAPVYDGNVDSVNITPNSTSSYNTSSHSSSTINITPSSTSASSSVLIAFEVDGPSHVAVNCPSHELGAAVYTATADSVDSTPSGHDDSSSSSSSVLVAIEVDGPSHVAVNCPGHELGATVCRNWLLQQWGCTVLVVPWWQWQDKPDTPGPS